MGKIHSYTIAFISWMVFVTWSSLFSFSSDDIPKFEIPHLDKAVHFTFYFVAVLLGVMSLRENFKGKYRLIKSVVSIAIFMVVFGIIIEVLQYNSHQIEWVIYMMVWPIPRALYPELWS